MDASINGEENFVQENKPLLNDISPSVDPPIKRVAYFSMLFGSMGFLVISSIFFVLLIALVEIFHKNAPPRRVFLFCLSGLGPDTIEKLSTPQKPFINIDYFIKNGVSSNIMRPSYPTSQIVNQYSIATGLNPESNGIIGDKMFDRVVRSSFDIHSNDSSWWDGEPIWIHAEKNKKKTLVDWAGSLISFDGVTPSYTSPNLTISGILQYFEMPNENQPQFIALNYPHLRNAMTKFGMMSSQASEALCRFDDEIGQLLEGLTERNVTDSIDIVIVSDSGMYPVLSRLNLDEIVPSLLEKTSIYENIPSSSDFSSTYVNLEVKHPQDISPILQCLNSNQNLKCHLANQIPSRFHIANSTRIGDIHCRSIPGTIISLKDNILPITQAASGYDNLNNEMQASFISYGSLFKKNYKMKEFKNIDVFNVISYLLDLDYIGNQSGIDTIQEIVQLY